MPAVEGESPEAGTNLGRLAAMRATMFDPQDSGRQRPVVALFVGGMDGIHAEHRLFAERFPEAPVFALGRPGGAAAELAKDLVSSDDQPCVLANSRDYGSLMGDIVTSLAERI